jgi:hypothetical protein
VLGYKTIYYVCRASEFLIFFIKDGVSFVINAVEHHEVVVVGCQEGFGFV